MWNTKACRIQVKLNLVCESSSICNNWQLCCLRTPGLPGGIYLKVISGVSTRVMAVGDVNQTIYEWRGSAPKYMLSGFEKDFTKVQKYNLSYTFRYGHLLSMMANEVIQYNQQTDESMYFSSM